MEATMTSRIQLHFFVKIPIVWCTHIKIVSYILSLNENSCVCQYIRS